MPHELMHAPYPWVTLNTLIRAFEKLNVILTCRAGSVFATVELTFGKSVSVPLKPLEDEVNNGKLGLFTVDSELDENPTFLPTSSSTSKYKYVKLLLNADM